MPSKTKEQEKLFNIAAHDPEFAKKHGIDPKVAKEWHEADKKKKKKKKKALEEARQQFMEHGLEDPNRLLSRYHFEGMADYINDSQEAIKEIEESMNDTMKMLTQQQGMVDDHSEKIHSGDKLKILFTIYHTKIQEVVKVVVHCGKMFATFKRNYLQLIMFIENALHMQCEILDYSVGLGVKMNVDKNELHACRENIKLFRKDLKELEVLHKKLI